MNFSIFHLLPWVEWIAASALGQAINRSPWAFAVIESVHLLGLAVIGGAVLLVDLRLLGFGLEGQPLERVARDAWPWFVGSWVVMIVTGVLLFVSEPLKLYSSEPFFWKMTFLLSGSLFAVTVRRRVTLAGEGRTPPTLMRLVGLVSLLLWFGVGASGRWIGFG